MLNLITKPSVSLILIILKIPANYLVAEICIMLGSLEKYSVTHPHSFRTEEASIVVSHTVKSVLFVIPDLFQRHQLKYVLLAKSGGTIWIV